MLHRRTRGLAFARVLAAATIGGGIPVLPPAPAASAAVDPRLAQMASPSPTRGLVYIGLSLGRKGSACEGLFEVKGPEGDSLGCTHGPDPAPPGVDVRQGRSDEQLAADRRDGRVAAADAGQTGGAAAGLSVGNVGCIGDGVSGSRVQAIYAVPADRTDRSATVIPTIRSTYAPQIDWQLSQSAAETGGEAHPIFVTKPTSDGTGCQLAVSVARLSAAGDDSYSDTLAQLQALGYDRPDRKYLIWMDSNLVCGWASMLPDTTPDQTNKNNGSAPFYARVDSSCWGLAEGHELMHTLGAVQQGAPHASADGHCWDEPDNMCYDDETYGPREVVTLCPGRSNWLFDCNHDDYFYAGAPPPSNWLATHWNVWTSRWLLRTALPAVATVPPTGTTSTSGTGTGPLAPTVPDPPAAGPTPRSPSGYWMLTSDGHVHAFGSAAFLGQPYPLGIGVRAVDLEPTPSGNGYWVVDDSGRVRTYGDASGWGSVSTALLDKGEKTVSISATPTGRGYWVFTTRGRAVPFGDAGPFGHIAWLTLNRPVIGSVATPSGQGYYLFAADGGIFTFGDAHFFGSTGGMRLNQPVVGMAVAPDQGGYWLVAADGGLFAFGNAAFYGSMGAVRLNRPVSAVVPGERGYLMVAQDGGAFSFGDVAFFGSLAKHPPATPVISVALRTS